LLEETRLLLLALSSDFVGVAGLGVGALAAQVVSRGAAIEVDADAARLQVFVAGLFHSVSLFFGYKSIISVTFYLMARQGS